MTRKIWLPASIVIGLIVAYSTLDQAIEYLSNAISAGGNADLLFESIKIPGSISIFVTIWSTVTAALGLFLRGLLGLVEIRNIRSRLNGLTPSKGKKNVSVKNFKACMGNNPVVGQATELFLQSCELDESADGEKASPGIRRAHAGAANSFVSTPVVSDSLAGWFFQPLAIFLGGGALLIGLIQFSLNADIASAPVVSLAKAVAVAIPPFGAGLLIHVIYDLLQASRRNQFIQMAQHIDRMFNSFAGEKDNALLLRQTAINTAKTLDAVRKGQRATSKSIVEAIGKLEEEVAGAVSTTLSEPLDMLTKASKALSADQATRVGKLIDATLEGFVSALNRTVGGQAYLIEKNLNQACDSLAKTNLAVTANSKELLKTLEAQGKIITKSFDTALGSIKSFEERREKKLTARLDSLLKSLRADLADGRKAQSDFLRAGITDLTSSADKSLGRTAKSLEQASSRFADLDKTVAGLIASLEPSLKQLNKTQEDLSALVKSSEVPADIKAAAESLKSASQASRDSLGAFTALSRSLQETTGTLANTISDVLEAAREHDISAPKTDKLSKAIRQLRDSTDRAAKELPDL